MATFLTIYSKSQKVNLSLFSEVISDFTLKGSRNIMHHEFKGMLLYIAKEFEGNYFESNDSVSFVSGHISFEKIANQEGNTTTEKFDNCLKNGLENTPVLLEGAFAAIHYNKNTNSLFYLNDKFGLFPLFVFENSEYVILSNEYHPLAQFDKKINLESIAEFLTLGVTLGSKTFFKNIKNLEPASFVESNGNKTSEKIYWTPKSNSHKFLNINESARELYETFKKVNQEYLNEGLTDMCLLTAGADSRLIVSTLTKEQLRHTKFYTSNLSFLDPLQDKDVIGASALASKFTLKHTIEKISFYENEFNTTYFEKERELRKSQVYGGWHGGEFLGGYCLKAVPINKQLNYEEVNSKLKSIFNWRYRFKLKKHPYTSYLEEKEKLNFYGNDLLFQIYQMTRSFFTNIYGGTRGHWVQPFQLMNHGISPFWDSRLLQLLIQIPISDLENYSIYNKVFQYCDKEFTQIPSNSPLTNREDAILPKMDIGIEPKHQIPNTHHKAYKDYLNNNKMWERKFYNKKSFEKILVHEFDTTTKQWLDFEVWYSKYFKE